MEEIHTPKPASKTLNIPQAIIIGCFLIAFALFAGLSNNNKQPTKQVASDTQKEDSMKPIELPKSSDHIRGAQNPVITIVEYSDTECPFCKVFHLTMQSVIAKHGDKVAWVYRHFPIESLHQYARDEANATECAATLGGEEKFWQYLDKIFEVTPSNDKLDQNLLPKFATELGINEQDFNDCFANKKYDERIAKTMKDGADAGVSGTPMSFIVKDGKVVQMIQGAWPEDKMEAVIKKLLEE